MKKSMVILGMLFLSIGFTFAGNSNNIGNQLNKNVIVDLSNVDLNENEEEFVTVKFNFSNNQINILEIEGSQNILKEKILQELQQMNLSIDPNDKTTYSCKFVFVKE